MHAEIGDEGSDIDEEFEFGAGNLHEELLKKADAD
jgi:hypothetical protein